MTRTEFEALTEDRQYEVLYEVACEHNTMPYGTMKARTGDPDNWIADRWDDMVELLTGE